MEVAAVLVGQGVKLNNDVAVTGVILAEDVFLVNNVAVNGSIVTKRFDQLNNDIEIVYDESFLPELDIKGLEAEMTVVSQKWKEKY